MTTSLTGNNNATALLPRNQLAKDQSGSMVFPDRRSRRGIEPTAFERKRLEILEDLLEIKRHGLIKGAR